MVLEVKYSKNSFDTQVTRLQSGNPSALGDLSGGTIVIVAGGIIIVAIILCAVLVRKKRKSTIPTAPMTTPPAKEQPHAISAEGNVPAVTPVKEQATPTVSTPKFCPNCGKPLTPGVKFCPECGHPLNGGEG